MQNQNGNEENGNERNSLGDEPLCGRVVLSPVFGQDNAEPSKEELVNQRFF